MADSTRKILVVDDDQSIRMTLFEALNCKGYDVSVAENGRMAFDILQKSSADLVIADIRMPEMDGLELLNRIHEKTPDLPVVIMTAYATVDTAVLAMKQGAADYILKPFPVEIIEDVVERIFTSVSFPGVAAAAQTSVKRQAGGKMRPIIGTDEKLLRIMQKAKTVASSKATVLLLGESGTGKEVFARFIHNESDRRDGAFVALNCAALPEGLLESELFGHEKGAFTGAITTKKGKFELADGGTLLLDEIGEIPLHLQAKLLRVLQEEEVDRLGGKAPMRIDVHVLATTNLELDAAVKNGSFREDLYYRLNVIPLRLPPLRERKGDIPLLAEHFVEKYSLQYGREVKKLSRASRKGFMEYGWPGNVREMENVIERAVLLCAGDTFEPYDFWDEDVPADMRPDFDVSCAGSPPEQSEAAAVSFDAGVTSLKDGERQMILHALRKTDNNRTHAAKMLGVSVRTLRNKLNEYRSQGFVD